MKINIPVSADLLPFLDRQEVRYTITGHSEIFKTIIRIDLEIDNINLNDFGIANRKYGISLALKYKANEKDLLPDSVQ